jgi:hypothetical protein
MILDDSTIIIITPHPTPNGASIEASSSTSRIVVKGASMTNAEVASQLRAAANELDSPA